MTSKQKAAAVGEYVIDAIDAYLDEDDRYLGPIATPVTLLPPVTLDEIYRATRIAAGHAIDAIEARHAR